VLQTYNSKFASLKLLLLDWNLAQHSDGLFVCLSSWSLLAGIYISLSFLPCRYDSRNSVLEWSIILIDQSNRSGSMEFAVPATDPSSFFPISVGFSASSTFSDLKVTTVLPLREGSPPKFSQRIRLVADNYSVIWCWGLRGGRLPNLKSIYLV